MYDFYEILFFLSYFFKINILILLKKIHSVKKNRPVKQTHSVKHEFYFQLKRLK